MPLPPVRALPILYPPKRLTSAVISAKPHQRSDLLPSLCFGGVTEGATKKLRSNIRRSTETGVAVEMRSRVPRQGSRESTDGSTNSNSSDGTCVQPTPTVSPPSTWVFWSPAQGWKIWLGLQARYLSSSVLLPPSVPVPWTPAAWAPVSLFAPGCFSPSEYSSGPRAAHPSGMFHTSHLPGLTCPSTPGERARKDMGS